LRNYLDETQRDGKRLEGAAKNINELSQRHSSIGDFSIARLLPKNKEEQQRMGLDWSHEIRREVWDASQSFIKRRGLTEIREGISGWLNKIMVQKYVCAILLRELKEKKGIVAFLLTALVKNYSPQMGIP
jgi:hypothetical protein